MRSFICPRNISWIKILIHTFQQRCDLDDDNLLMLTLYFDWFRKVVDGLGNQIRTQAYVAMFFFYRKRSTTSLQPLVVLILLLIVSPDHRKSKWKKKNCITTSRIGFSHQWFPTNEVIRLYETPVAPLSKIKNNMRGHCVDRCYQHQQSFEWSCVCPLRPTVWTTALCFTRKASLRKSLSRWQRSIVGWFVQRSQSITRLVPIHGSWLNRFINRRQIQKHARVGCGRERNAGWKNQSKRLPSHHLWLSHAAFIGMF